MAAERVAALLEGQPLASWIQGGECEGSKFHSPRPLLVRPYHLNALVADAKGEPVEVRDGLIHLCAVCFDNLTVYLSILIAYDGATPNSVRRDFANLIRDLGDTAWEHYLKRSASAPV